MVDQGPGGYFIGVSNSLGTSLACSGVSGSFWVNSPWLAVIFELISSWVFCGTSSCSSVGFGLRFDLGFGLGFSVCCFAWLCFYGKAGHGRGRAGHGRAGQGASVLEFGP